MHKIFVDSIIGQHDKCPGQSCQSVLYYSGIAALSAHRGMGQSFYKLGAGGDEGNRSFHYLWKSKKSARFVDHDENVFFIK